MVGGSNLRRYCRGDAIPSTFEPLEKIGLACGASELTLVDGPVRRFGLHVPASIDDALAAAAWTFDLDRRTYQGLDRAT
jgi:hypothetical protein